MDKLVIIQLKRQSEELDKICRTSVPALWMLDWKGIHSMTLRSLVPHNKTFYTFNRSIDRNEFCQLNAADSRSPKGKCA